MLIVKRCALSASPQEALRRLWKEALTPSGTPQALPAHLGPPCLSKLFLHWSQQSVGIHSPACAVPTQTSLSESLPRQIPLLKGLARHPKGSEDSLFLSNAP